MPWNYRVVCRTYTKGDHTETTYAIHTAYYRVSAEEPDSISKEPVSVVIAGDGLEDLKEELERFQAALSKPILNYEDFNQGNQPPVDISQMSREEAVEALTEEALREDREALEALSNLYRF